MKGKRTAVSCYATTGSDSVSISEIRPGFLDCVRCKLPPEHLGEALATERLPSFRVRGPKERKKKVLQGAHDALLGQRDASPFVPFVGKTDKGNLTVM